MSTERSHWWIVYNFEIACRFSDRKIAAYRRLAGPFLEYETALSKCQETKVRADEWRARPENIGVMYTTSSKKGIINDELDLPERGDHPHPGYFVNYRNKVAEPFNGKLGSVTERLAGPFWDKINADGASEALRALGEFKDLEDLKLEVCWSPLPLPPGVMNRLIGLPADGDYQQQCVAEDIQ